MKSSKEPNPRKKSKGAKTKSARKKDAEPFRTKAPKAGKTKLAKSARRKSASTTGSPDSPPATKGVEFGIGTGKFLFRIRHTLIADHYVPLIAAKAYSAVKLDLVLRAVALLPEHCGERTTPGLVLDHWKFEHLYDLATPLPRPRAPGTARSDQELRHLKRKWVGNQLSKLANERLVEVRKRPGRRPKLLVLSDDGNGGPFDDPGAAGGLDGNRYVTVRGSLIATNTLRDWRACELAAYLAAIYAESHNERGGGRSSIGDGMQTWWRQLSWFNDISLFPRERVPIGFSKSLLEDGIAAHCSQGLMSKTKMSKRPGTGELFETPRNLYSDNFGSLDRNVTLIPPAELNKQLKHAQRDDQAATD